MPRITKSKKFLILCLAFILGVGLRSLLIITPWILVGIGLIGLIIILLFWKINLGQVIGFSLIVLVFGMIRFNLAALRPGVGDIQFYNNQKINFTGIVSAEPDIRLASTKLTIKVTGLINDSKQHIKGKVLVTTYLFPEYSYGDLLDIQCLLKAPEPVEEFSYDKYLARYGIYSVCYRPIISLRAHDQGNFILAGLLKIKKSFIAATQSALPEPQASFLGGLLLGAKRSIPDDLMQSFNRTGTTHIVALSGYNITIIGVVVINICRMLWVPRKKSFWVSLHVIFFFVLITGAQASVVRAGIMGSLMLLATKLGRISRITNALVLAAMIMVAVNPRVLVFDTGFQLSFLATTGLVFISPIFENIFKKLPSILSIKENLIATLSATVMTLPLIAFQFGRISIVAPLVNILVLPAVPLAMGLGFVLGILSLWWLPLGQVFGWLVWAVLSYIIFIIEFFSRLNFSSINL